MTGEGPVRLGPHTSTGLTSPGSPQWQQRADVLARQGMAGAARRRSRLMRVESVLRFLALAWVFAAVTYTAMEVHAMRHTGDRIVSFIIAVVACAVTGFVLGYVTGSSGPCDCCDVVDRG